MKPIVFVSLFLLLFSYAKVAGAQTLDTNKYIFERDSEVVKYESGPHNGGGSAVGYSFFNKAPGYNTGFKKRVLNPGSSIGYHTQDRDEVYYIISGKGVITLGDQKYPVKPGDAILTRTGGSHGIAPNGKEPLVLIIVYDKTVKP